MFTSFPTYFLLYLLPLIPSSNAVLVNVTVDDSLPDPLTGQLINFLPTSAWNVGVVCTDCHAAVDGEHMLDRTWHDGTYFPDRSPGPLNITFTFNGTAIYVFCALALEETSTLVAYSNMTFYIDGHFVGQFERSPSGKDGFDYNVSVYSNTSLSHGQHKFMLQIGQFGGGGNASLTLFDYLVYSYDNGLKPSTSSTSASGLSTPASTPSTPSVHSGLSTSVPVIVGAVVGGVSGAITVLIVWFLIRRRQPGTRVKRNTRRGSNFSMDDFSDGHIIPDPFLSQNVSSQALTGSVSNRRGAGPYRELDAGPVTEYKDESEEEATLPPEYNNVFASSSSQMSGIPAPPSIDRNEKS